MAMIYATSYKGYTEVSREISINEFIEEVKFSTRGMKMISKINELMQNKEVSKASNVKKQLPFYTATANYESERLGYSLKAYNHLITIDIDEVGQDILSDIRKLIEADSNTVACFLSPRQNGLKVLVYMDTPIADHLRQGIIQNGTVDYDTLIKHHAVMYEMARKHVEEITGVDVDTSGKDIGRGIYLSQDKDVYFNEALLQKIVPITSIANKPLKGEQGKRGVKPSIEPVKLGDVIVEHRYREIFKKAIECTRKKVKFEEGSRNVFIYQLGLACYRRFIPLDQALTMAIEKYGNSGEDIVSPLRNGYHYSEKAEEADSKKKLPIEYITEFLTENYVFRYNEVAEKVEYRRKIYSDIENKDVHKFKTMEDRDLNSIVVEALMTQIKTNRNFLRTVIQSDFSPSYNPFVEYFAGLPEWDGTDYIKQLADTVTTTNQEFWHMSLEKWLVGMVACATIDKAVNQHVLMLYSSGQGIGKSTWVRRLLPPELEEYQRTGMVNSNNKDHSMLLTTHLLVNLDEFDGVKRSEVADLKRAITQDSINERKAYAADTKMMVRRASFIASTNNQKCLQDMEGNRRFLMSTVLSVDLSKKINHTGLYSQAYHLLTHSYRYWFEGQEIADINNRNEHYRMKEPAEELFYVHFRKASAADYLSKWYPAAQIMAYLGSVSRISQDVFTQNTITKVLERDCFNKRMGESGLTEYQVTKLSFEEVENESKYRA